MKKQTIRSPLLNGNLSLEGFGERRYDPNYRAIFETITGFGALHDALAAIRENPSPTETQASVALRYAKQFGTATDSAKRRLASAANTLQAMQNAAEDRMQQKTKLGFATARDAEIRSVMRSLSDDDRIQFLNEAVKSGNAEILSSVMAAPAQLSSLKQHTIDHARETFIKLHAPEFLEEVSYLDRAQQALELGFQAFSDAAEKMREPLLEARAREETQAFDDANAALKAALGQ